MRVGPTGGRNSSQLAAVWTKPFPPGPELAQQLDLELRSQKKRYFPEVYNRMNRVHMNTGADRLAKGQPLDPIRSATETDADAQQTASAQACCEPSSLESAAGPTSAGPDHHQQVPADQSQSTQQQVAPAAPADVPKMADSTVCPLAALSAQPLCVSATPCATQDSHWPLYSNSSFFHLQILI